MKMLNQFKSFLLILLLSAVFGCNNYETPEIEVGEFSNGVWVINEGGFSVSGELSFYSFDTEDVQNNVYAAQNGGAMPGSFLQSLTVFNNTGYLAVDNANQVQIIDMADLRVTGQINDLAKPQQLLVVGNNKAYVSEWGEDGFGTQIAVVNLSTRTITERITVGQGPKQMILANGSVYVLNTGGFGSDDNMTVINPTTDEVENTITLVDGPNSMVVDAEGFIWVACSGRYAPDFSRLEVSGALLKVDPGLGEIVERFDFESEFSSPSELAITANGQRMYYLYNGGVYDFAINASALNDSPLIERSFYGLGINNRTGQLFLSDPLDFNSDGKIVIYSSAGIALDSANVGLVPGSFYFTN